MDSIELMFIQELKMVGKENWRIGKELRHNS